MNPYPLPFDTAQVLGEPRNLAGRCSNAGLLYERLVPRMLGGKGDADIKRGVLKGIQAVVSAADPKLLSALQVRWRATAAAMGARTFSVATDWRLIVGLGRSSPVGAGFTFHHLYGLPIIPGSALKGLARAFALTSDRKEGDPELQLVFGREATGARDAGSAGSAIFFDAIPAAVPSLEIDIINSHFPEYYAGKSGPTDWQNPVPVCFLTVPGGTTFHFAVGLRRDVAGPGIADLAARWLKGGLRELGAGAKTTSGYGYFQIPPEALPSVLPADTAAVPASFDALERALEWRKGTVKEYRGDKGWGKLVDAATGQEVRFEKNALVDKGWTPGKKVGVEYAIHEGDETMRVTRLYRLGRRPTEGM